MNSIKKRFGVRLKELRESKGMNQEQLAEIVGLESRHISRIETGKSFTSIENIEKIANALNIDINLLFYFEHKQNKEILIEKINNYLKSATQKQTELAYKFIKYIFN